MIAINGYFRSQQTSGQQRYGHEMSERLLRLLPGARELRPVLATPSRYGQWLELQLQLPMRTRRSTLVSLTSRTPVVARRQIVTIHDLFPLTNPEWFTPAYARLHRNLLRHHLRSAAGIVVVSEPVADQVRGELQRNVPVVVAPNASAAVLARRGAGERPGDLTAHGSTTPDSYFLTVGNIEPRKNLGRLVRAYGLLDEDVRTSFPLLVVGGRATAFRTDHELEAAVPSGVRFLGRIPDGELAALYGGATAFVSVSLAEGFGIPVVEAASAGCGHLVLSDLSVYRWIAGDTGAIYVDPLSEESIAQGLLRAARAKPDLGSLSEIAGRFSWDESAAAVARLAEEVDGS